MVYLLKMVDLSMAMLNTQVVTINHDLFTIGFLSGEIATHLAAQPSDFEAQHLAIADGGPHEILSHAEI